MRWENSPRRSENLPIHSENRSMHWGNPPDRSDQLPAISGLEFAG